MKQCHACPWKKSTNADTDIPNGYDRQAHRRLQRTIAKPAELNLNVRVMACHESPVGAERPCVGWLHHQLTIGNNIGLRFRVFIKRDPELRFDSLELDGEQHETFEATLGEETP